MTDALHSRQSLESLKLSSLKAIASQIGATPIDRRSIRSHITAILDRQPQPVPPTSDSCQRLTNTRNLQELRDWCQTQGVLQGENFEALYRNILNNLAGFEFNKSKIECGCIDRAIQDNSQLAELICIELEIVLVDLSLNSDLVIPHGQDAYHVTIGGQKVAAISTFRSSYFSSRSNMAGCDDPYSATLEFMEWCYGIGEIEIARASVERDLEIKVMKFTENEKAIFKGARDNNFEDCFEEYCPGYLNNTWVFAVIEGSGLDPKVARGAIASLVKKGMVQIDDYEGKGRANDMTFCLTAEGVKAGNSVLMPEYV